MSHSIPEHRRVLVVDDNPDIHEDFRKILAPPQTGGGIADLEAAIFGQPAAPVEVERYDLSSAHQGQQALELLRQAKREGRPFALAFVDMRMPPGWDGLETIEHLWKEDPELQVVICTAYSDHSREDILNRLGRTHRLMLLKKPFDTSEIAQFACAMTEKWRASRHAGMKLCELEEVVRLRTAEIASTNKRLQQQVHELELVRQALEESEERYALAARGANDGLWDWDLRTDKVYCSKRAREVAGFADDQPADNPEDWFARMHPNDAPAVRRAVQDHLNGATSHLEVEYRVRTSTGQYMWVLSRGVAVRDEEGCPARMAGSITDISRRKESEDQLRRGAYFDRLTGLPNRALLRDCLERTIKDRREGTCAGFAVLFLDFDRFKVVNDSLGHLVGDQLLVAIAERLSHCIAGLPGRGHTVARLGGDEFVILLRDVCTETEALAAANAVHRALLDPFVLAGNELHSTVSIGITLDRAGYTTPDEVLRDADTAMYHAKSSGRARQSFFDAAMHEAAIARLRLESDLRRAIMRGDISVLYQPIICLKTGGLVGVEALARWSHPEHGPISPERFIPIAEETGLIVPLGEHVLRVACSDLRRLRAACPDAAAARVNVNLSSRQFAQPSLVGTISGILNECGVPAQALALEVTETVVMDDFDAAAATIRRLRETGIDVYMDDFGTGYSSLSCLKSLPLSGLKLDRSFVANLGSTAAIPAIIHAIVTLSGHLGLGVVAEGVETNEQLASVLALECHKAQGYLFGKPMNLEQLLQWVLSPPSRVLAA
ncbi:MAG TPA: EAL domain-containing protein [Phycisphaerales bacterium]|nr:EAL domain-containing protein [Phycisphaerales bacterium]